MFVCCDCCVLSGRALSDELITRPEESYRLWCVVVCDLETSRMRRPWPALGRSAAGKKYVLVTCHLITLKLLTHNQLLIMTDAAIASDENVPSDYFIKTVNIL